MKAKVCITPPELWTDSVIPQPLHLVPSYAVMRKGLEWNPGEILTCYFIGGTSAQRAIIRTAAETWEKHCSIRFVFTDEPTSMIRIAFEPDGAWSYIGTLNRSVPFEKHTMNFGFIDPATALHEFGHALGLEHEHLNSAGGIEWNEEEVIKDLSGPPNNWDRDKIYWNVLQKLSIDQVKSTVFDRKSIMLYWFPATWTKNGISTERNTSISVLDSKFVNNLYKLPPPVEPPPIPPIKVEKKEKNLLLIIGAVLVVIVVFVLAYVNGANK